MRQSVNQQLAALANIETSVSKAQLRHTQYGRVAVGEQKPADLRIHVGQSRRYSLGGLIRQPV
jgi:hypothetical protein